MRKESSIRNEIKIKCKSSKRKSPDQFKNPGLYFEF